MVLICENEISIAQSHGELIPLLNINLAKVTAENAYAKPIDLIQIILA